MTTEASPSDQARRAYEAAEARTAQAMEGLVASDAFGEVLAMLAGNALALRKIATDSFDLVLRNLRLVSRSDITRIARQQARTEDKLELLLQEVERLQDALVARTAGETTDDAPDPDTAQHRPPARTQAPRQSASGTGPARTRKKATS